MAQTSGLVVGPGARLKLWPRGVPISARPCVGICQRLARAARRGTVTDRRVGQTGNFPVLGCQVRFPLKVCRNPTASLGRVLLQSEAKSGCCDIPTHDAEGFPTFCREISTGSRLANLANLPHPRRGFEASCPETSAASHFRSN